MTKCCFILTAIIPIAVPAYAQTSASTCKSIIYENHNQSDPDPLSVSFPAGRVIAEAGVEAQEIGPVPDACLGLFTEARHRLMAMTVADKEGEFKFGKVPIGKYRLVVRAGNLCVANVPLQVTHGKRGTTETKLVIHMRPAGIDRCSYGDYK